MSTDPILIAIRALQRDHMRKLLQTCIDSNYSNDICDYYENMCADHTQKQLRKKKPNNNNKNTPDTKNIFINDDLHKCQFCHSVFVKKRNNELNFNVILKAKPRVTSRSAKIYSLYKRLVQKYRYKSYRSKLIKQVDSKGIKLFYKCKKCQSDNLVFKEMRRLTPLKLIQPRQQKTISKQNTITSKSVTATKPVQSDRNIKSQFGSTTSSSFMNNSMIPQNNVASKNTNAKNKKFQNLKLKLEAEMRQQKEREAQNVKTTTSLFDFLQKI